MYWSSLFSGDTWKDGVGVDMRRELQGLTWSLGCGIRDEKGRETGRNEVLKPNCYIVAGLFQSNYIILIGGNSHLVNPSGSIRPHHQSALYTLYSVSHNHTLYTLTLTQTGRRRRTCAPFSFWLLQSSRSSIKLLISLTSLSPVSLMRHTIHTSYTVCLTAI